MYYSVTNGPSMELEPCSRCLCKIFFGAIGVEVLVVTLVRTMHQVSLVIETPLSAMYNLSYEGNAGADQEA
jgi:hypothetical protein